MDLSVYTCNIGATCIYMYIHVHMYMYNEHIAVAMVTLAHATPLLDWSEYEDCMCM